MNKKLIARLVSSVFHPTVFAVLAPFIVIYKVTADIEYGIKWMIFTILFLVFVLLSFFLVRPKEFLEDFDIAKKQDRHIFYSIGTLAAILYFIISLVFKGVLFPLSIVALGIMLGLVVFDLVNYYIKISIHTAVICAFVVTFGILYGIVPFLATVWLVPVMVWSRLLLKKHTKAEAIAGVLVGTGITIPTVLIGKLLQL